MKQTPHSDLTTLPDRLPDFFILGGPKCGTTSLFGWLQSHPDTFLPHKEPNFLSRDVFDARSIPGAVQDWPDYLARLTPPEEQDKVTGESTPRYLYSDLALDILSRHPARPRMIAILRNPIDLVYSLHGQMVRQGIEKEPDFARAWARSLAAQDAPGAWSSADGRTDHRLDYPMFGRLGRRLQALQARVEQDQLRIFILEEDLTHAPTKVLVEVLEFLDLPPADIDISRRNERIELRFLGLHRQTLALRNWVMQAMSAVGINLTQSHGKRRGTGLIKLLIKITRRRSEAQDELSVEMRKDLAEFFRTDVSMIEAELGRSIAVWQDWQKPKGRGE